MTIRSVAIVAVPGVAPFELGIAWEGFGVDRTDEGIPRQDCILVSVTPEVVTGAGWTIRTPHRLEAADTADLVVIPAFYDTEPVDNPDYDAELEQIRDLLRRTVARGARVMSFCSGAFLLGSAGLLDGRECTTHWRHTDELAARHPLARIDRDVLFVCDGPVLTSAGTAAGLDLCLHLIRQDHGEEVARKVARRMVMPPHRDGGQAQYVEVPIRARPADTLAPLLDELLDELADDHSVDSLAARSAMSPRTFARRFHDETGTSPHLWLTHQRVLLARRMLESGTDSVDAVADRCGFSTAAMLRHHFTRIVGTSPTSYRRTFRVPA
ncbi:GlxA family transcriptional regulator [uncultured Jatrophihabitans sp.]|uniref:GlxA family transcriptional regulator n=1 Tax=uncultured Jatrophihabitans sp. TaxID=1610747 RepID=UPI0035C9B4F9